MPEEEESAPCPSDNTQATLVLDREGLRKFGDVPWGALETGKAFEPFPACGMGRAQRSVKPPGGDRLLWL